MQPASNSWKLNRCNQPYNSFLFPCVCHWCLLSNEFRNQHYTQKTRIPEIQNFAPQLAKKLVYSNFSRINSFSSGVQRPFFIERAPPEVNRRPNRKKYIPMSSRTIFIRNKYGGRRAFLSVKNADKMPWNALIPSGNRLRRSENASRRLLIDFGDSLDFPKLVRPSRLWKRCVLILFSFTPSSSLSLSTSPLIPILLSTNSLLFFPLTLFNLIYVISLRLKWFY